VQLTVSSRRSERIRLLHNFRRENKTSTKPVTTMNILVDNQKVTPEKKSELPYFEPTSSANFHTVLSNY
jgi:hypothetical protein